MRNRFKPFQKKYFWVVLYSVICLKLSFISSVNAQPAELTGVSGSLLRGHIEYLEALQVYFNAVTHKVHRPDCLWVSRCTAHCEWMSIPQAFYIQGQPCKICKPVLNPEKPVP
jgi:hypothetical protein